MALRPAIVILLLLPLAIGDRETIFTKLAFKRFGGYNFTTIGNSSSLINDIEIQLFNITDDRLKDGVEVLAGSRPDVVFLNDPGSQFSNDTDDGWRPPISLLAVERHELVKFANSSILLETMHFNNDGEEDIIAYTSIYPTVIEKFNHTWINMTDSKEKFIFYSIGVENVRFITYGNVWGENREVVWRQTMDENLSRVRVSPGTRVTCNLFQATENFELTILYKSVLEGEVLAFWRDGLQGPRLRAFDIQSVLKFGGMPTEAFTTEVIKLDRQSGTWVVDEW